jgi:hypothetical protein
LPLVPHSYGYLENKAFRHGDIEDVLTELLKRTGGGLLKSGSKFKGLDVKRVYFGYVAVLLERLYYIMVITDELIGIGTLISIGRYHERLT